MLVSQLHERHLSHYLGGLPLSQLQNHRPATVCRATAQDDAESHTTCRPVVPLPVDPLRVTGKRLRFRQTLALAATGCSIIVQAFPWLVRLHCYAMRSHPDYPTHAESRQCLRSTGCC